MRNVFAPLVEAGRWIGEGGFIVRAQLDRSAESASTGASPGILRRRAGGRGRRLLIAGSQADSRRDGQEEHKSQVFVS